MSPFLDSPSPYLRYLLSFVIYFSFLKLNKKTKYAPPMTPPPILSYLYFQWSQVQNNGKNGMRIDISELTINGLY